MSEFNLRNSCSPSGEYVPSPSFEDIGDDLQAFLRGDPGQSVNMADQEDDDMEVDLENSSKKRGHPTTEEDNQSSTNDLAPKVKRGPKGTKRRVGGQNTTVSAISNARSGGNPKGQSACAAVNNDLEKSISVKTPEVNMEKRVKYDAYSRAPFIVLFRIKSVAGSIREKISLVKISQILCKYNIKFTQIAKYSRDTWKATFPSKTMANSALNNKPLQEAGISAYIPKYKVSRKVVIKEIPEDMTLVELKQIIEDENSNVLISNMFRLKRRNRLTKALVDSEAVCLEIRGEVIPEKISILRAIVEVNPYVQSIRLCFKCGRIGHISKFCERPDACLTCAGNHRSSRDNPCMLEKSCINCNGAHSTMDRDCPLYRKHLDIARVMAYDNLPFLEARSLVEKNGAPAPSRPVPAKSLREFPLLPSGRSSSDVYRKMPQETLGGSILYSSVLSNEAKGNTRDLLFSIIEMILADPEADVLCDSIKKTIDLHMASRGKKKIACNNESSKQP